MLSTDRIVGRLKVIAQCPFCGPAWQGAWDDTRARGQEEVPRLDSHHKYGSNAVSRMDSDTGVLAVGCAKANVVNCSREGTL